MSDFLHSKTVRTIVLSIGGLFILVFVFAVGLLVGFEKAEYSFSWAKEYHNIFAGPKMGFLTNVADPGQFLDARGSLGEIIKINDDGIIIKDKYGVEKNILVDSSTSIMFQKKNKKLSDLQIGDRIIIIGCPDNSGNFKAEFIRIMPGNNKNQIKTDPTTPKLKQGR